MPGASGPCVFDHVALVVRDLEAAVARADAFGVPMGPIEDFPSVGTREVYVGDDACSGRLLLVQPLGTEGPYASALARRGAGLHHVAIEVADMRAFLHSATGWYLHRRSLETFADGDTAWLARPGFGALLEVRQADEWPRHDAVVTRIELPVEPPLRHLLAPIEEACGIVASSDGRAWLEIATHRVDAVALAS